MPPTAADGVFFTASMLLPGVGTALIMTPFVGTYSRFLTNWNPVVEEITVSEKDGAAGTIGTISVKDVQSRSWSLLEVFGRTWRIEGVSGFFAGAWPATLAYLVGAVPRAVLLGVGIARDLPDGVDVAATLGPAWSWFTKAANGLLFDLSYNLALAPFNVLATRAFVSPFKQKQFSLDGITTEAERANPLNLFRIPGLVGSVVARVLLQRALAMTGVEIGLEYGPNAELAWGLLWAVLDTPLDLISTRIQGHPSDAEFNPTPASERRSQIDEDDIAIRPVRYAGVLDAVRAIIAEEGWSTLFRGWTWNILSAVAARGFALYVVNLAASDPAFAQTATPAYQ